MIDQLKTRIIFLLVVIFSAWISGAQITYLDKAPYCDESELKLLFEKSMNVKSSLINNEGDPLPLGLTLIEIGNRKYLLPDGSFHVYEWQDSTWTNLYLKKNTAYNFNSQKFDYKGDLYSFGGYGYWRLHGDLIRFDWEKNEWEIVPYQNYPEGGNGPVFVRDSFLYVIEPIRFNDGLMQHAQKLPSYAIDLNNGKTKKYDHPELFYGTQEVYISSIETENYLYLGHQPAYIFDKTTLQFYSSDLNPFIETQSLTYITGDRVRFYSGDLNLVADYDLAKIIMDFKKMEKDPWSFSNILILTAITGVLSIGLLVYLRRKRWRKNGNDLVFDQPLIHALLEWQGQSITSDKLDELLNIHDIRSAETLRFKRSQLINQVNMEYRSKAGRKLIYRIQDPEDKRKFIYRIN